MSGTAENRVVIVTGAGRGIGRAEALEFARQGAKVVVNEFGRLDVLVNNAGILRDRMFVSMSEREWDEVIAVHLRGTFVTSRHAVAYWRELSKAGREVNARIINTSSSSGLYGNAGQSNYSAAKAAIASMTIVLAEELARYGVTVNAIAPQTLTRMTEGLRERTEAEKAEMDPTNIAPLVAWLGSPASRAVTGQIFNIKGSRISVAEGPQRLLVDLADGGGRQGIEHVHGLRCLYRALERPHVRRQLRRGRRRLVPQHDQGARGQGDRVCVHTGQARLLPLNLVLLKGS